MTAKTIKTSLAVLFVGLVALAPLWIPAAEDATILFRYSDNLARTGIISYNAYGPHVEGATDFLWMVLLAASRRLGISPHAATGPLNAIALCGIAWVFANLCETAFWSQALFWTGVISMLCPQMVAALSGFSVLPFGCLLLVMFRAYLRESSIQMALSALILCLFRPDGLVFALPLLAIELFRRPQVLTTLKIQCLGFYLPAMLYMAWRVHYFQHLFPLPFLVKSQTHRWLGFIVVVTLEDISRYLSIGFLTVGLLWKWKLLHGKTLDVVIAGTIVPTLFYLEMRLDQNLADRFFIYLILLPAFLFCLHRDCLARWKLPSMGLSYVVLAVLLLWPDLFAWIHLCTDRYLTNSEIATELTKDRLHGTLAVSEAGVLAYRTGWPTTDLWGLNTPRFAERLPQPADIAQLHADIIILHYTTCRASPKWQGNTTKRSWSNMSQNVLHGVSPNEYEEYVLPYSQSKLALRSEMFTDGPATYLCYFIDKDYPSRRKLEAILTRYGGKRES